MNRALDTFSERLRDLIFEKFKHIKDFATDIDISETTINSWLKKKRQPTIYYLDKVCEYFGVSADYLIGREN